MDKYMYFLEDYLDKHEHSFVSNDKYKLLNAIDNLLWKICEDERVIEEMAKYISTKNYADDICEFRLDVKGRFHKHCYKGECQECILEYFRKKCV